MRKDMIVSMAVIAVIIVPTVSLAKTPKKSNEATPTSNKEKAIARGSKLFVNHCASCHAEGGNTITPVKPVRGSQVLSTMATFKSYLNQPIGDMPHYEDLITDQKLLSDLYAYTKDLDKPARSEAQTKKDKGSKNSP